MSLQTAKSSRLALLSRLAHLSRPRISPGSIHPVLRKPSPEAGAPARVPPSTETRPSDSPRRPEAVRSLPVLESPIPSAVAPVPAPVPPPVPPKPAAPLSHSTYPVKGTAPTPHTPESREVRVGMARVPVRWLTRT